MSPPLVGTLVFFAVGLAFQLAWLARPVPALPRARALFEAAPVSGMTGVLGRLSTPDPSQVQLQKRELDQAGYRAGSALPVYLAARTALALGLPLLAFALHSWRVTLGSYVVLLGLAALGYYLPAWVVKSRRAARQLEIRHVLPDALDMLVACVESGLGIDAALRHTARELAPISPVLAEEIEIVGAEMQAGLSRGDALRRMDERVGVDDVTALVSVISQGERYGTGIAESIRTHAQMARRRRLVDAERRAAEATPKLTVVMVLFILPPLFVVLVGPTILQVVDEVIPMLEGR